MRPDHARGNIIVDELLRYTRSALIATGVSLSWWTCSSPPCQVAELNVHGTLLADYIPQIGERDPMLNSLSRNVSLTRRITELKLDPLTARDVGPYMQFLTDHGYRDEIDMVLTHSGAPMAVLGVLTDAEFRIAPEMLDSLRRFLEQFLGQHPYVREQGRHRVLTTTFGVTGREFEVLEAIREGASNFDIAEQLGIGIATVKAHVASLLDKVGVDSRLRLVALSEQL